LLRNSGLQISKRPLSMRHFSTLRKVSILCG
jgi:hypothetical protein